MFAKNEVLLVYDTKENFFIVHVMKEALLFKLSLDMYFKLKLILWHVNSS